MTDNAYLAENHRNVSILALRMSSRKRIGMYLNIESSNPLPSGLLPDYNGLAECIGFSYLEICNFARHEDPTNSLLNEWGNRPDLEPNLGKLVEHLLLMQRVDVLEDCKEIIKNDADNYLVRAAGSSAIRPLQDETVSQSPFNIDDMNVDETTIMTIQDVEAGGPTYYDAFVCYHPEGEDLKFVQTMIEKMETPQNKLKLFVPHRDDLPGASKHVISAKLIQDRCKRMVIVMSPRYLQSSACDFQTKFAHALSPGSRSKKLVPVLVKPCETPNILRHVTMCDYTRGDLTGWFWERLIRSLQAPLNPEEIRIEHPNSLSGLQMANLPAQKTQFAPPPKSHTVAVVTTSASLMKNNSKTPRSVTLPLMSSSWSEASIAPDPISELKTGVKASPLSNSCDSGTSSTPFSTFGLSTTPLSVSDSGPPALPMKQPEETLFTTFSSQTKVTQSVPASPASSRKNESKKKNFMSKFTSVFSPH